MKTKKFIEEARDLGLFVEENKNQNMIWIKTPHEDNHVGEVKTNKIGCRIFDESKRFPGISRLIYEYGMSPLEEREEEKKYIYRFPFHITARNVETKHICRNHTFRESGESNDLIIDLSPMDTVVTNEKFLFTDKEIEKYTGKDEALFNVCEKIEVTP